MRYHLIAALLVAASVAHGQTRDAKFYVDRGSKMMDQREYDRAIADFDQAIKLDPKVTKAYLGRGIAWHEQREYDKAIADYTEVLRRQPTFSTIYIRRGGAWLEKREYEKAIEDFAQAIRIDSKDPEHYYSRGVGWSSYGKYDKAIADFSEAIRLDAEYTSAFYNRGNLWHAKREYNKAIADYSEAIRIDPKLASGFYNRGNSWINKGEIDKGIADLDQAIKLDAKQAQFFYFRGIAWQIKEDYGKSISDHVKAAELDPNDSAVHNFLAMTLASCPATEHRDGARAIKYATKACQLTKWEKAGYLDTLAAAHAESGKFEEAVRWQQQAIDLLDAEAEKGGYQSRLELYKNRQPYRLPAGAGAAVAGVTQASESTPEPLRTWTSASGKFAVEASFVGYEDGVVTLRRDSGKTLKVPLEKLSEADRAFVKGKARPH